MCLIKKQKNGYLELCQLLIKKKLWAQGSLNLLHTKSPEKQATLKEPQGSRTGTAPHMRGAVTKLGTVGIGHVPKDSRQSPLFLTPLSLWNSERRDSSRLQYLKKCTYKLNFACSFREIPEMHPWNIHWFRVSDPIKSS